MIFLNHCNGEEEEALQEASEEYFEAWNAQDRAWLLDLWNGVRFQDLVKQHISLESQLAVEGPGPKRTALVNELFALKEKEKSNVSRFGTVLRFFKKTTNDCDFKSHKD